MKLLMCSPSHYDVKYEINPWMDIKKNVDQSRAMQQWEALYHTLAKLKVEIELIPQETNVPDMVFTANAGLLYQGKIVLPYFKYPERQKETRFFRDWFEMHGFEILNNYNLDAPKIKYFEGAGDALVAGDKLFVGYGFRSEKAFYEEANYFEQDKIIYCELIDSYYYHIDTCFCPLNDNEAIWFPDAFSKESQARMHAAIKLIDVPREEAAHFACNAVVVGKNIVLPQATPVLTKILQEKGMSVFNCDMTEYIKAGGACKCLTLKIG